MWTKNEHSRYKERRDQASARTIVFKKSAQTRMVQRVLTHVLMAWYLLTRLRILFLTCVMICTKVWHSS